MGGCWYGCGCGRGCVSRAVQGYLAHNKQRPLRTLKKDYAWGPLVLSGGGAVSYEEGTPVDVGTMFRPAVQEGRFAGN